MSDTDYVRQVEEFFLDMVGQGMALPEGDIKIILQWKTQSVPLEIIKTALRKEADRLCDMGRELPVRLHLYRGEVEKAVSKWQVSAEAGFSPRSSSTGEDLITGLRSRVDTANYKYRDRLIRCLDGIRNTNDPDRINQAIIKALSDVIDPDARKKIDIATEQAETRGLQAGMGRMAAKNLGLDVRKQMLAREVEIEDLFV